MTYLDSNKFYMNPHTGSIAKGSEWEDDFTYTNPENLSFEDWGAADLIELDIEEVLKV